MTAPDRAYDPKRRPNTFYKGDPASDKALTERAANSNAMRGSITFGSPTAGITDKAATRTPAHTAKDIEERAGFRKAVGDRFVLDEPFSLSAAYAPDPSVGSMPVSGASLARGIRNRKGKK